jgi:6-pyruvoyltetrahydropterin/6-carboxytetrahydropterin synthase
LNNFTSTKTFKSFPCTHRQPAHKGHCRFIHGYDRDFVFHFKCKDLEPDTGFVVEFGGKAMKELKAFLERTFDHTFLANEDDPELELFKEMEEKGLIQLRILPNVCMEATSKYLWEVANRILKEYEGDRCWCYKVEVRENFKNSGTYKKEVNGEAESSK